LRQLAALKRFDTTRRVRQLARVPTLVSSAEGDLISPRFCGKIAGAARGVTIQSEGTVNRLLLEHFQSTGRS